MLDVPEGERAERTWGNDVLTQVEGVGAFVRVLIPIRLIGGYTVTYGAWLDVHPKDLRHAWEVWLTPEYAALRLAGFLANGLPPWETDTYGKAVAAVVLDADKVPYAVESSDEFMRHVLQDEWPHDLVLGAIA